MQVDNDATSQVRAVTEGDTTGMFQDGAEPSPKIGTPSAYYDWDVSQGVRRITCQITSANYEGNPAKCVKRLI